MNKNFSKILLAFTLLIAVFALTACDASALRASRRLTEIRGGHAYLGFPKLEYDGIVGLVSNPPYYNLRFVLRMKL